MCSIVRERLVVSVFQDQCCYDRKNGDNRTKLPLQESTCEGRGEGGKPARKHMTGITGLTLQCTCV